MSALIFTRLPACPYKVVCATGKSTDLNFDTKLLFTTNHFGGTAILSTGYPKGSWLSHVPPVMIYAHSFPSPRTLHTASMSKQGGGALFSFSFPLKLDVWVAMHTKAFWREAAIHFIVVPKKKESTFIEILLNFNNLANLKISIMLMSTRDLKEALWEFKSLWRPPGAKSGWLPKSQMPEGNYLDQFQSRPREQLLWGGKRGEGTGEKEAGEDREQLSRLEKGAKLCISSFFKAF